MVTQKTLLKFQQDGFLHIPALLQPSQLKVLSNLYGECLSTFFALDDNAKLQHGMASFGTTWIYRPEALVPALSDCTVADVITEHARGLLDSSSLDVGFRIFHKPPLIGDSTPWHQDEAYQSPDYLHHSLNCWLPLQDVSPATGALRYIPGPVHSAVVEHEAAHDSITNGLRISAVEVDESRAVDVSMRAGDAVFHHCRTLHSSHCNRSVRARQSMVVVCSAPKVRVDRPTARPWLEQLGQRYTA